VWFIAVKVVLLVANNKRRKAGIMTGSVNNHQKAVRQFRTQGCKGQEKQVTNPENE
jgi:hypothetical protein